MKKSHKSKHPQKITPVPSWSAILDILHQSSDHCILVAPFGPKNAGKSTMIEYLISQMIQQQERELLLLQLDLGRPLFTLPSILCLYDLRSKTTLHQVCLDEKSPQNVHQTYLKGVQYLTSKIKQLKEKSIVFVNNCGWVEGLGQIINLKIHGLLQPTISIWCCKESDSGLTKKLQQRIEDLSSLHKSHYFVSTSTHCIDHNKATFQERIKSLFIFKIKTKVIPLDSVIFSHKYCDLSLLSQDDLLRCFHGAYVALYEKQQSQQIYNKEEVKWTNYDRFSSHFFSDFKALAFVRAINITNQQISIILREEDELESKSVVACFQRSYSQGREIDWKEQTEGQVQDIGIYEFDEEFIVNPGFSGKTKSLFKKMK